MDAKEMTGGWGPLDNNGRQAGGSHNQGVMRGEKLCHLELRGMDRD